MPRRGLLYSNDFIDATCELVGYVGIDLANAGDLDFYDWWEHTDCDKPIVLSIEDSRVHLDEGNFNRTFELLRSIRDCRLLCIFVVLSMMVGAKIEAKHLRYISQMHTQVVEWEHQPEFREQIQVACQEYISGSPYTLKEFDFGNPWIGGITAKERRAIRQVGPQNYHEPVDPKGNCWQCLMDKRIQAKQNSSEDTS